MIYLFFLLIYIYVTHLSKKEHILPLLFYDKKYIEVILRKRIALEYLSLDDIIGI